MSFVPDYVEHPDGWLRGREAAIKRNAAKTRRAKLLQAIEPDGEEFRAWLLGDTTPELRQLYERAQSVWEEHGYDDNAAEEEFKVYHRARQAFEKRLGQPPQFLAESLAQWGGLTDKQLEVARRIYAERAGKANAREAQEAERRANAQPWTAGRQEITGVVQSARWESYSVNRWNTTTSLKGLVLLADGRKLWTTLPARLYDGIDGNKIPETVKGATITIKVTVEVSKDDPTMAFGKRPT